MLQETFWDETIIEDIKPLWEGNIFYSNSTNNRSGVAILVHKKWTHSVNFLKADDWGRMISIEINIENTKLNLMSIYAPNNCTQREIFLLVYCI